MIEAAIVMTGLVLITAMVLREVRASRQSKSMTVEQIEASSANAAACAREVAHSLDAFRAERETFDSRLKGLEIRERERLRGLRA